MTMTIDRRAFMTSLAACGIAACSPGPELAFPELEAEGDPGDLGLAHGRAFARKIRANLEFYLDYLSLSGRFSQARLLELAGGFSPILEECFPDMLEEIDGIARGSGMALNEVLLINARTDILAMVEAEVEAERIPACTALALRGRVGRSGRRSPSARTGIGTRCSPRRRWCCGCGRVADPPW